MRVKMGLAEQAVHEWQVDNDPEGAPWAWHEEQVEGMF